MQPVPGPQLVADRGLETAIDLPGRAAVRADVEPLAREMPLQRPQPRHGPVARGEHDLPHLRRGPLRPLPLQPERQLEHPGRRMRKHNARLGNERVEPAQTVRADPLIQRAARDPDQSPVRADMLQLGADLLAQLFPPSCLPSLRGWGRLE